MRINCHYVPQFILKRFGKRISVYNLESNKMNAGLVSDQTFFISGLYSEDLEHALANRIETSVGKLLADNDDMAAQIQANTALFRAFLITCLLRIPKIKNAVGPESFETIIQECLFNYLGTGLSELLSSVGGDTLSMRVKALIDGRMIVIETDPSSDPFLISDTGPVFLDNDNAVYPISPHTAIGVNMESDAPFDQKWMESVNGIILDEAFGIVGMTALEDVLRSISSYAESGKRTAEMSGLIGYANRLINGIKVQSPIGDLIIPEEYRRYLGHPVSPGEMESVIQRRDYQLYTALIVLDRFRLLGDGRSVPEGPFFGMDHSTADGWLIANLDFTSCEFDKCMTVPFLERAAESGNKDDCDKLRRYYKDGRHVIQDSGKSNHYLDLGCRAGHGDCLVAYYKTLEKDPDYLSKMDRYPTEPLKTSGTAASAYANVYSAHGDHKNCVKWLKVAARANYKGAIDVLKK